MEEELEALGQHPLVPNLTPSGHMSHAALFLSTISSKSTSSTIPSTFVASVQLAAVQQS
jgi:hypothetical protein